MSEFNRELLKEETKLIKEISRMKKFSFKMLLKCIELDAILSYRNN